MVPQPYRERERWRVELLELRRKIDRMIFDLVDKDDEERIRSLKGRGPSVRVRYALAEPPVDSLPEEPAELDHQGGPERRV